LNQRVENLAMRAEEALGVVIAFADDPLYLRV